MIRLYGDSLGELEVVHALENRQPLSNGGNADVFQCFCVEHAEDLPAYSVFYWSR